MLGMELEAALEPHWHCRAWGPGEPPQCGWEWAGARSPLPEAVKTKPMLILILAWGDFLYLYSSSRREINACKLLALVPTVKVSAPGVRLWPCTN